MQGAVSDASYGDIIYVPLGLNSACEKRDL